MDNRRGTLFVLVLGIALAAALWAIVARDTSLARTSGKACLPLAVGR